MKCEHNNGFTEFYKVTYIHRKLPTPLYQKQFVELNI